MNFNICSNNFSQIKRSAAWTRAFEELKRHKSMLAQLGKSGSRVADIYDSENGPKPPKIRNINKSSGLNGSKNSKTSTILKDLRVNVERLSNDTRLDMQSTSGDGDDKSKTSTSRTMSEERKGSPGSRKTSEERQVRGASTRRLLESVILSPRSVWFTFSISLSSRRFRYFRSPKTNQPEKSLALVLKD